MSFSFGGSKSKQTTKENSTVNPWAPAQPLLKSVLGDLGTARTNLDPSGIVNAINASLETANGGNPAVAAATDVGNQAVASRNYVPQAQAAYRAFAGRTADTANGANVGEAGAQYLGPDGTGPMGDLSRRLSGTADGTNIDSPANPYAADLNSGYGALDKRLSGTADGTNLDLGNNTYLQKLLTQVGDEAQGRVNAQFAAAGRDLSGANNIEVGKGVTSAQLPLLLDQYNREQGRTDAAGRDLFQANASTRGAINTQRNVEQGRSDTAARDLYSADAAQRGVLLDQFNRDTTRQDGAARDLFAAGTDTAKTSAGLDASRLAQQTQGVGLLGQGFEGQQATDAQRIELERLKSQLPIEQLGWLTQLLYPAAGLGSQSTGDSLTKGTKFGAQAGYSLVPKT